MQAHPPLSLALCPPAPPPPHTHTPPPHTPIILNESYKSSPCAGCASKTSKWCTRKAQLLQQLQQLQEKDTQLQQQDRWGATREREETKTC